MIYIDENDPEGDLEPSFPPRNVTISRGIDAKEVYDLIAEVGRGKFGTVYKCREKSTGLKLAAKFVPIPKREDRRNVEREVELMNSLQHHLIIQLYAAYEYQKMMCVVLELIEGGELFERVIDDNFILTEKACTVFIRQVCEAMQFIHNRRILHLDLKPENILCVTNDGNRIKIIDFGLARKFDPDKKLQILFGTPEFVAPEVVNFDSISFGTDMWSVGVICYVLLSGLSPFMGETDIETMANVTVAKYDFDDEAFSNVSSEALDFITKLLVKDISGRMTATECLGHKWLQRQPTKTFEPSPPVITPTPVYITTSPTPPREMDPKELETTKDNLRSFIERWEDHPNSPYIFDNESNFITPLRDTRSDSMMSSRACSPSPCESICSAPEEDLDNEIGKQKGLDDDISTSELQKVEDDESKKKPESIVNKHFKDYLHSFDRRNSDTNYILGRRPSGEKINLADEIRKLSDHLLMLSEINIKLGRENNEMDETKTESSQNSEQLSLTTPTTPTSPETIATPITPSSPSPSITSSTSYENTNGYAEEEESRENPKPKPKPKLEKLEKLEKTQNIQKPQKAQEVYMRSQSFVGELKNISNNTFNRSSSVIRTMKSSAIASTATTSSSITASSSSSCMTSASKRTEAAAKKISALTVRLQTLENNKKIQMNGKMDERSRGSEEMTKKRILNGFKTFNPINESTTTFTTECGIGVPWPVTNRRTKFRINQLSRDVPVGSPNSHQTYNLEEAANTTKDCLLHLLDKYNQTKLRNGPGGRHQSISVDWNISDNLEYKSMSSINAFFQRHNCKGGTVKHLQTQIESKNPQE